MSLPFHSPLSKSYPKALSLVLSPYSHFTTS
nr:MAG TPA: hypothetical protein [Bacteriophage sp.]